MVTESTFGRREVESRLNVSSKEHANYHTLECVASTESEEAFTLFSISGTAASVVFGLTRGRETQTPWSYVCRGQVCGYGGADWIRLDHADYAGGDYMV